MAPRRSPPELMEDLVAEILLRLPPDNPACLIRASLVCKPWRRLLSDRDFLRRYRAYHAPPLLGFFHNRNALESCQFPRFVPTTSGSPVPLPASDFWSDAGALDCRHGRVLLHKHDHVPSSSLVVWDPVTGDRQDLPNLDINYLFHSATVLCAVGGCDHADCHGGPFRVVAVGSYLSRHFIWACSYSSETDVWSTPATVDPGICPNIGWLDSRVVIGDEIYLTLGTKILRYDLGKNCFSAMIQMPDFYSKGNALMLMEDDSLGLAGIRSSSLYLWSMKVNPEGVQGWVQYRVIELQKSIPIIIELCGAGVIGCAEGVNIIFVSNGVGTFAVELKSGRVRKVDDRGDYCIALPYMRFYTPGFLCIDLPCFICKICNRRRGPRVAPQRATRAATTTLAAAADLYSSHQPRRRQSAPPAQPARFAGKAAARRFPLRRAPYTQLTERLRMSPCAATCDRGDLIWCRRVRIWRWQARIQQRRGAARPLHKAAVRQWPSAVPLTSTSGGCGLCAVGMSRCCGFYDLGGVATGSRHAQIRREQGRIRRRRGRICDLNSQIRRRTGPAAPSCSAFLQQRGRWGVRSSGSPSKGHRRGPYVMGCWTNLGGAVVARPAQRIHGGEAGAVAARPASRSYSDRHLHPRRRLVLLPSRPMGLLGGLQPWTWWLQSIDGTLDGVSGRKACSASPCRRRLHYPASFSLLRASLGINFVLCCSSGENPIQVLLGWTTVGARAPHPSRGVVLTQHHHPLLIN
ncbi:hypothetical protein EJB05_14231 [Eragrostis curvula]|uniref:F-box domain-containing protein n=1 Tax=Eragrostis curvula TaxID=38414 RepID=A0A5J9VYP4_9POAL|nr:hypothetical protein EJB05_14231 [Eragrostis curvula]